jgi:hypothetical protein
MSTDSLHTTQRRGGPSDRLFFLDVASGCILSVNTDGSDMNVIVDEGSGDDGRPAIDVRKWCVGIEVEAVGGSIYWTQKGGDNAGDVCICHGSMDLRPGQVAADRQDIEVLYEILPEPINLELALDERIQYWTNRADPAPETLSSHLMKEIGCALDLKGWRMFITDFPDRDPLRARPEHRAVNEPKRGAHHRKFLLWTLRLERRHS